MTKEEFDQLGSEYGFFTYRDSNKLFLKPQYMWGDIPVMTITTLFLPEIALRFHTRMLL